MNSLLGFFSKTYFVMSVLCKNTFFPRDSNLVSRKKDLLLFIILGGDCSSMNL